MFKNLVKLGVKSINSKITKGRTVFNLSCKTSVFMGLGCELGTFLVNFVSFFLILPPLPPRWTGVILCTIANSCECWQPVHSSRRWQSARSVRALTHDFNIRRAPAKRAPASFTLRCRSPTRLVLMKWWNDDEWSKFWAGFCIFMKLLDVLWWSLT